MIGSFDWLGINHYASRKVGGSRGLAGCLQDLRTLSYTEEGLLGSLATGLRITFAKSHLLRDVGVAPGTAPEWELTDMGWPIVPEGMEALLRHVSEVYRPRCGVYVTENGVACREETSSDATQHGGRRIDFLRRYIAAVGDAVAAGADVRGYFLWTFMDNFEWSHGTSKRFGIVHVDFQDPVLPRQLKPAARWYAQLVAENALSREGDASEGIRPTCRQLRVCCLAAKQSCERKRSEALLQSQLLEATATEELEKGT